MQSVFGEKMKWDYNEDLPHIFYNTISSIKTVKFFCFDVAMDYNISSYLDKVWVGNV